MNFVLSFCEFHLLLYLRAHTRPARIDEVLTRILLCERGTDSSRAIRTRARTGREIGKAHATVHSTACLHVCSLGFSQLRSRVSGGKLVTTTTNAQMRLSHWCA